MYTEKTIIAIININKANQELPDNDNVANNPTRAERADAIINIKIGSTALGNG